MTSTRIVRLFPALVLSLAFIPVGLQAGPNLVLNPSFENLSPGGADTSFGPAVSPPQGPTGALSWNSWNSNSGTTSTADCLNAPSGDPNCTPSIGTQPTAIDGLRTLHVTTDVADSGIWQAFLPANTGPMDVVWSVWIYVVTGQVDVAVGNGGTTSPDQPNEFTSGTGVWQNLTGHNSQNANNSPANEITIYSVRNLTGGPQGAEFYVDAVSVTGPDIPEPGTIFGAASALLLFAGYRLRRR